MSLKSRARSGDRVALDAMFRQFLPVDERIDDAAFLGLKGVFGIGSHSFGAVTDRRVASLQLSMFGGVRYQDGYHEHVNSSEVFQPSKAYQFLAVASCALVWLSLLGAILTSGWPVVAVAGVLVLWVGVGILLAPAVAAVFYLIVKSGLVLIVREGARVYCFTDRRRLGIANELASRASELRDQRMAALRATGRGDVGRNPSRPPLGASGNATGRVRPVARPTAIDRARDADALTVVGWASATTFVACVVRLLGLTLPYRNGVSLWDADLRLVWLVPVTVCALASLLAVAGGRSPQQLVGISATVGSALVIGLQVLFDVGLALDVGSSGLGSGFWVTQAGGVVILVAVAVLGAGARRAGLIAVGGRDQTAVGPTAGPGAGSHDRTARLVLAAGAITTVGAVMPWLTSSSDLTGPFWGGTPADNVLYGLFLACTTVACIAAPVVAVVAQPRRAGAGLLFGWSAALLGWAVGYELEGDFLFGFRLFEVGVVASLTLAVLLLAGWTLTAADADRAAGAAGRAGTADVAATVGRAGTARSPWPPPPDQAATAAANGGESSPQPPEPVAAASSLPGR